MLYSKHFPRIQSLYIRQKKQKYFFLAIKGNRQAIFWWLKKVFPFPKESTLNHHVKLLWAAVVNPVMKVFHSAKHNTDYYPFRKPADVKNHNFLAQTLVYSRARKSHHVKLTCRAALWDTFISSYSSATQHFKRQPLLTTKSSCQQITWKHSAPSINSTTLGIHNTANWLLCLSKVRSW